MIDPIARHMQAHMLVTRQRFHHTPKVIKSTNRKSYLESQTQPSACFFDDWSLKIMIWNLWLGPLTAQRRETSLYVVASTIHSRSVTAYCIAKRQRPIKYSSRLAHRCGAKSDICDGIVGVKRHECPTLGYFQPNQSSHFNSLSNGNWIDRKGCFVALPPLTDFYECFEFLH